MRKLFANDRPLIAIALAWLGVLCFTPAWPGAQSAFCVSILLIAGNTLVSLWWLTARRTLLIGLNCIQIVLFGTLSFQLYSTFGAEHYRIHSEPGFFDWVEFTAVHVLRAADLLDALDEYGIHLQSLTHHSSAAGVILVCMHLTVDVFLIGLVLRWAKQFWPDPPAETRLAQGRRDCGWLLVTLAVYVGFAACQQLSATDWLLWPIDNLLRLLDVGDCFQLFGWQLHSVEANGWTSSAAILFRLVAGFWMARLVMYLRMTMFRTWGLSIEELTQLLDDADAHVRRGAVSGLGRSGPAAAAAVPALIDALHDIEPVVRCEAARALGCIGLAAHAAGPRLVDAVWLGQYACRLAAITAFGQIRPDADCLRSLAYLWTISAGETQHAVTQVLAKVAPEALARLQSRHAEQQTPEPKRKPWQLCVEAAQRRQQQEESIHSLLVLLLQEGCFAKERDSVSLQYALAARGQRVELAQLFVPLLMLTISGKLSRRKDEEGRWVYLAAELSPRGHNAEPARSAVTIDT